MKESSGSCNASHNRGDQSYAERKNSSVVANSAPFAQPFCMINESELRKLRYRLNRQGMLELDAWLAPLEQALNAEDGETVALVEAIVATDTPKLLAMMHGETEIPKELRPWLER